MCAILQEFKADIERYCTSNGLSAQKVFTAPKSYNQDFVFLQFVDPEKGRKGLMDETPAPVTLKIYRNGHGVTFEQTEYTKRYLAK